MESTFRVGSSGRVDVFGGNTSTKFPTSTPFFETGVQFGQSLWRKYHTPNEDYHVLRRITNQLQ